VCFRSNCLEFGKITEVTDRMVPELYRCMVCVTDEKTKPRSVKQCAVSVKKGRSRSNPNLKGY